MKKKTNINININTLLNIPSSISEKFHQKTKIYSLIKSSDNPKNWPKEWKTIYYKGYPRLKEIKLLPPEFPNKTTLKKVLLNRISTRKFSNQPITIKQLSSLLYFSAGIKENNRFYPSAGARYPLEIYIVSLNIQGLSPGIYHYYLKSHSLEYLSNLKKFNLNECFDQSWTRKVSCFIIITAIFKRTTIKYGDRGYRYILIEVGHLGQNIYLNCEALNLGCCAIGGFVDDKLNDLLDIDGLNESAIYVFAIGTKI